MSRASNRPNNRPQGIFDDYMGNGPGTISPEEAVLLEEASVEMDSLMETGRMTSDPLPESGPRVGSGVRKIKKK